MNLHGKIFFGFQTFVGGFALYAACSIVVTAIYAAMLEDGMAGLAVPPLVVGVGVGLITAMVSLVLMILRGVRALWRPLSRSFRAVA
jgi:hypothetical protein